MELDNYKNYMLKIKNLEVAIENKKILKNFNLEIKKNEIHFIMGPNGSGKSTLSKTLVGHPSYKITKGSVYFKNKKLNSLEPENRSKEGLFLAFQYPIEIVGVNNFDFLKIAYNEKQKYLSKKEIDPIKFLKNIKTNLKLLKINEDILQRDINVGFSGGEKKINEILQMLILKPNCVILDEIDSGLDIDALKKIFTILNKYKEKKKNFSMIIITHNPKLLNYISPNKVHIIKDGKIIKSGETELVQLIDKYGYKIF